MVYYGRFKPPVLPDEGRGSLKPRFLRIALHGTRLRVWRFRVIGHPRANGATRGNTSRERGALGMELEPGEP